MEVGRLFLPGHLSSWLVSSDVVSAVGHTSPAGAGGLQHLRCEQQGLQSLIWGKMLQESRQGLWLANDSLLSW